MDLDPQRDARLAAARQRRLVLSAEGFRVPWCRRCDLPAERHRVSNEWQENCREHHQDLSHAHAINTAGLQKMSSSYGAGAGDHLLRYSTELMADVAFVDVAKRYGDVS